MKSKYKLSELPVHTTIDDQTQGKWIKAFPGVWIEVNPHCVDCIEVVLEDPTDDEARKRCDVYNVMPRPADEYLVKWKVFSWPETSVAVLREAVDKLENVTDILLGRKFTVDEFLEFLAWKESNAESAQSDTP